MARIEQRHRIADNCRRGRNRPGRARRHLLFEPLEARRLLATFQVTTTNDWVAPFDDLVSLREAITWANENGSSQVDQIYLDAGTYRLNTIGTDDDNSAGDLDVTSPIVIWGRGQGVTIIDAYHSSRRGHGVLQTFGSAITIRDVTIQGGRMRGGSGAGIRSDSGDITLINSVVSGIVGSDEPTGGGIYTDSGNIVLQNSIVSDTASDSRDGGAIVSVSGNVTLDDSIVERNTASYRSGGGIATFTGNVFLNSSRVSGNSTIGDNAAGAGIHTRSGVIALLDSTVTDNRTYGQ